MPSNYKTVINFRDGIQVDTDDLISNNGLVGIGSTIPRQQLDVRGNVIIDENTELNNLKTTGVTTFYGNVNVGTGYSVGIGTTVPEAVFQIGIGTTGFTVTEAGIVSATKFYGDGSALSNIPASVWVNPGAGDTIYSVKDVGIGTDQTRDGADFGVGYEIYMDAKSGVGTFEGIKVKNITVENTTGAGQGNVTAEVGTFSTVTATTQIEAPSFIGTITEAIRAHVAVALTDTPNIDVNYITGVGGTFTGITSFATFQGSGGIVGSAGIITANTFSGSATTAAHAAIAYGIGGDPDIQVDKLSVNGVAPSFIQGAGISTIGQDLLVGEFLGVGATLSASGDAAGFIGTVRIHDGDLKLGGSISIGGSLVGTVDLGGTQTINVLNVGAGLSVAGITTLTGTITGGANMNITGNVTANELDATDSVQAGGGITCGGGIMVGTAVTGSEIRVLNGGGLIIGSGITMDGAISGATTITASGDLSCNDLNAAQTEVSNLNVLGVSTLGISSCSNLTVGGDLNVVGTGTITTGSIKIDGASGITSSSSFFSPTGVSTFFDLRVTGGNATRIFGKYIGMNTATPAITDGIELYENSSELFLDQKSKGVGIGSTSGDRPADASLYVGYGRSADGSLAIRQSIFECGNIGIGTTTTANQTDERVELYRNVYFGINPLSTGSTTQTRIGFNTDDPRGVIDLSYTDRPLCLPRATSIATGADAESAGTFNTLPPDQDGNLWYDALRKTLRIAIGTGGDTTGILTESYGKPGVDGGQPPDYDAIRGWHGPIVNNATDRDTDTDIVPDKPTQEPVGWGTANVVYYTPTNQFQHRTTNGTWVSQVGSATTGVEIIVNGTTAILNVAGIGSVTLGTLT